MSYDSLSHINTDLDWTKRGEGLAPADNGALIRAAKEGDAQKIRILAESGADTEAVDAAGWTALFHAIKHRHVKAVAELLVAGADVNAEARNGLTPIAHAVKTGSPVIISLVSNTKR